MKPSLCLNMIVKNEAARIERCLRSVLPHVKSAAIVDTGSTDDTKEIIRRVCKEHDVPVNIADYEFVDFSQARNFAFKFAQAINGAPKGVASTFPWCQFVLLMDADMELVVDTAGAFNMIDANAPAYDMMQKGGAVSYANRRLLNINCAKPPYVGVTHEYIDVPAGGMITGARFIDHADGSNRVNKYERDAHLLEEALKTDPNNGRHLYYLANTFRDWGKPMFAASFYEERIKLGGWDEETHSAMMNLAHCKLAYGDEAGFVSTLIQAYNFRPSRAEPLYDLAKHYREKGGNNFAALLFSKAGLGIERPNDLLFVNDFVYTHGLRYEYSISGYYSETERARAFEVTDDLALDPTCPESERFSARSNLYWHTKPLSYHCPSFKPHRLDFVAPAGYVAMNPSVEVCNGFISCNIRCVNYKINEHGQYMIGEKGCGDAPIDTRNFVCQLDEQLDVCRGREIIWHRPPAAFPLVTGLEDIRLYRSHGDQWFSATVREQAANGACQMVRGRLQPDRMGDEFLQIPEWSIMSGDHSTEKNWMPLGDHSFMYRLDRLVENFKGTVHEETKFPLRVHVGDISGGSQLVPFKGGWVAVVHEAITDPNGKRTYWHRFAWFERSGRLRRLSLPFVFFDRQIEFACGLAAHPNCKDLIVSFGVRDAQAWAATISIDDVSNMCWKFHED